MGKIICVSGAAGHGKTTLLSQLRRSGDHNVAKWLVAPTLKQAQEALKSLGVRQTLVIDECDREVFEAIKLATYDGYVIAALKA